MENEINLPPSGQKYVMFLPERYFKSTFFENIYKKLRKNLENLGINLFCIENFIGQISKSKSEFTFDDKPIPVTNQLYIHMFKNFYYSDSHYNKKRMEKEREHLFLLAGKLGVHEIKYSTEITETEITSTALDTQVANVTGTISHKKTETKKEGMGGSEKYENRGASVYVDDKHDIKKVEEDLQKLSCMTTVFSYEFYKQCPKLESFVLKRCSFRMSKVEYYIESEDISELSLAVKAYFNEYGLGVSFEKNILSSEKIKYELEFFKDSELEEECVKRKYENQRGESDPFYSIRKCYENWTNENDKKSILWEIYDYVFNVGKNCYGHLVDESDNNIHHFFNFEELFRFLLKSNLDKSEWENFTHTEEIKDWIEDFFYENFFENIMECDNEEISNGKLASFLKNNYPFVQYKKIQQNIKWININWNDPDDKIEETIRTDLNNNCKKIELNKLKLYFTVTLGDNILSNGKKISNSYVIKRTYAPVSRLAKNHNEENNNENNFFVQKINELISEQQKLLEENEKLKAKQNDNNLIEENEKLLVENEQLISKLNLEKKQYGYLEEENEKVKTELKVLELDYNLSKSNWKQMLKDLDFYKEKNNNQDKLLNTRLQVIEEQKYNLTQSVNENKKYKQEIELLGKKNLNNVQIIENLKNENSILEAKYKKIKEEFEAVTQKNQEDDIDTLEEKTNTNKQNKKHIKKTKNHILDS